MKKNQSAVLLVVGAVVVLLAVGFFAGRGGVGLPTRISTDLRNTLYLEDDTIKTTPESATILQAGNLLTVSSASSTFGGTINRAQIGSSGTALSQVISTTCNGVIGYGAVAASSTVRMDCAVTGVQSGDVVIAQLRRFPIGAAGDPTVANAPATLAIISATASSTNGFVSMDLLNLGPATSSFGYATTGIRVLIFR